MRGRQLDETRSQLQMIPDKLEKYDVRLGRELEISIVTLGCNQWTGSGSGPGGKSQVASPRHSQHHLLAGGVFLATTA